MDIKHIKGGKVSHVSDKKGHNAKKGRYTLKIRQNAQQRQCDPFNFP